MHATRSMLVLFVLGAVALSGCIGEDGEPTPTTDDDTAPPAKATETTGALQGKVLDGSLKAVEGATVAVVLDGTPVAETKTDARGQYTVNGLEPGSYVAQASAVLYKNAARSIEIVANDVVTLDLMLQPIDGVAPYQQGEEFVGMMSVGTDLTTGVDAFQGLSMTWGAGDENHQVSFDFTVFPEHLQTILVEVYWDNEQVGLTSDLWYRPNCDPGPCDPDHEFASESGFGSIQMRVDRPEEGWPKVNAQNDTLSIYLWPDSTEENPAVLAYQQRFTVYYETWYVEPAPEGRVVRPDA